MSKIIIVRAGSFAEKIYSERAFQMTLEICLLWAEGSSLSRKVSNCKHQQEPNLICTFDMCQ